MKRIAASIVSKKWTVSIIVKKLTKYESNRASQAIAEYDNILKTIHIFKIINSLKYIQKLGLRRMLSPIGQSNFY